MGGLHYESRKEYEFVHEMPGMRKKPNFHQAGFRGIKQCAADDHMLPLNKLFKPHLHEESTMLHEARLALRRASHGPPCIVALYSASLLHFHSSGPYDYKPRVSSRTSSENGDFRRVVVLGQQLLLRTKQI